MWLSLNILSELVNLKGLDPKEIGNRLTMSTAEIEGIEEERPFLKSIIAAKILKVAPHPNADKLTLVDLFNGVEEVRVVCGAKNHKEGDIVPLATIGTVFSPEFIIQPTKLRGEPSNGMLCSARELGFSDDHGGILILPADTKIGTPLSELFKEWCDTRIEIDNKSITHRPDLWGHFGFARELGAIFDREISDPVDSTLANKISGNKKLKIDIQDPSLCLRYTSLVIDNIKIEESPDWLKARLTSLGMRPINNIVDITNYVMAELGEPMHAFDYKKLKGDKIQIRTAKPNEKIATLDGTDADLTTDDIIIADANGPIAVAGVMGGANSEIDESTTCIVLEAACFKPVNIRKTAHRFNLRTEAAMRFEKSLDPELCPKAIIRCYQLIAETIPGAIPVSEILDSYPLPYKKIAMNISCLKIRESLGKDIPNDRILAILKGLRFDVKQNGDILALEVPSFRATKDVSIEEDIVEEIGRIYGYDNIEPNPPLVPCVPPPINVKRNFERELKNILARDHNMTEVSNYSFVGEEILERLNFNENKELRLKHPLSTEQDRMRRGLIPNIMENVLSNQRYQEYFRIFEYGRAYLKEDRSSKDLAVEKNLIAGAFFDKNSDSAIFYEAKSVVMDLAKKLKIKNITFSVPSGTLLPYMHPYRTMIVKINEQTAGYIFELHPAIRNKNDVKGQSSFFELDADLLFDSEKEGIKFEELNRFPDVPFEISVVVPHKTYSAELGNIITNCDKNLISDISVVSIYEGAPITEGYKSVSYKIIFSGKDHTLSPKEIEDLQQKIMCTLNQKGYSLR